jgi:hypothetical protein
MGVYGYAVPKNIVAERGGEPPTKYMARAIFEVSRNRDGTRTPYLSFLPDRQAWNDGHPLEGGGTPPDEEEKARRLALVGWVNETAIPALRRWTADEYILPSSERNFLLAEGSRGLVASPNGSYGYMYLVAWAYG